MLEEMTGHVISMLDRYKRAVIEDWRKRFKSLSLLDEFFQADRQLRCRRVELSRFSQRTPIQRISRWKELSSSNATVTAVPRPKVAALP